LMLRTLNPNRWLAAGVIGSMLLPIVLLGCERRSMTSDKQTSPILVRVNDESLTEHEFAQVLPEDYHNALTSEELEQYLDRWVVTQLLYDEGMRSGLVNKSDIETRLEQYRKDLIADQLVQQVIRDQAVVTEEEVFAYYKAHERDYITEFRVSHILVNTLEDAEKVKAQIGQRSFTYLARKYSIDKHSGAGGDLGYLTKGGMILEFEDIVFDMALGEVSDIIESEFGYHIIKIIDIREARFKMLFDDAKGEIASRLMMEKRETVYDSLVASLREKADIQVMDRAYALGVTIEPDTVAIEP